MEFTGYTDIIMLQIRMVVPAHWIDMTTPYHSTGQNNASMWYPGQGLSIYPCQMY